MSCLSFADMRVESARRSGLVQDLSRPVRCPVFAGNCKGRLAIRRDETGSRTMGRLSIESHTSFDLLARHIFDLDQGLPIDVRSCTEHS